MVVNFYIYMQKAPISSVLLLPTLLENIFQQLFSTRSEDQVDHLLLNLHNLLGGRLVEKALRIIDHQTITIYVNNPKTIEVAEICDTYSHRLVRLFPGINYCSCEYFKEKVLIKEVPYTAPYTCQHILAIRLAIALQPKCLHFKEVSSLNLDLLLNTFVASDLEVD